MTSQITTQPRRGFAPGSQPDVQLAYFEWGPADATPEKTILAIHGITANARFWDTLAEKLAGDGFRVIAYDLRGRGDSSKPASGYSLKIHAAEILAVLDYFNIRQVNLLGHSLGAMIGVVFAAHYPERIRRLVLIDGGAPLPSDTREAISKALNRLGVIFPSLEEYVGQFKSGGIYPVWSEYIERGYIYDARVNADGTALSKIPKPAIDEEWDNLMQTHPQLSEFFPQITAPTLLLRAPIGLLNAGRSGFILTQEGAELAVKTIKAPARLEIIEGTNHYTILLAELEQRDKVAGLIEDHLA